MESTLEPKRITFVSTDGLEVRIEYELIPKTSLLFTLITTSFTEHKVKEDTYKVQLDGKKLKAVTDYLSYGVIGVDLSLETLEFLLIDTPVYCDLPEMYGIQLYERWAKRNFKRFITRERARATTKGHDSDDQSIDDLIDPYAIELEIDRLKIYGVNSLGLYRPSFDHPSHLFQDYYGSVSVVESEEAFTSSIDALVRHLLAKGNGRVVIAGDSVMDALLCSRPLDYDICFVDMTDEEIHSFISLFLSGSTIFEHEETETAEEPFWPESIIWGIPQRPNFVIDEEMYMTSEALTVGIGYNGLTESITVGTFYRPINHICLHFRLRSYHGVEEILLEQAVDASCIVYDGTSIKVNRRWMHAFKIMTNVVDLSHTSTTYECELINYAQKRRFRVIVPWLDTERIDYEAMKVVKQPNISVRNMMLYMSFNHLTKEWFVADDGFKDFILKNHTSPMPSVRGIDALLIPSTFKQTTIHDNRYKLNDSIVATISPGTPSCPFSVMAITDKGISYVKVDLTGSTTPFYKLYLRGQISPTEADTVVVLGVGAVMNSDSSGIDSLSGPISIRGVSSASSIWERLSNELTHESIASAQPQPITPPSITPHVHLTIPTITTQTRPAPSFRSSEHDLICNTGFTSTTANHSIGRGRGIQPVPITPPRSGALQPLANRGPVSRTTTPKVTFAKPPPSKPIPAPAPTNKTWDESDNEDDHHEHPGYIVQGSDDEIESDSDEYTEEDQSDDELDLQCFTHARQEKIIESTVNRTYLEHVLSPLINHDLFISICSAYDSSTPRHQSPSSSLSGGLSLLEGSKQAIKIIRRNLNSTEDHLFNTQEDESSTSHWFQGHFYKPSHDHRYDEEEMVKLYDALQITKTDHKDLPDTLSPK